MIKKTKLNQTRQKNLLKIIYNSYKMAMKTNNKIIKVILINLMLRIAKIQLREVKNKNNLMSPQCKMAVMIKKIVMKITNLQYKIKININNKLKNSIKSYKTCRMLLVTNKKKKVIFMNNCNKKNNANNN